MSLSVIVFTRDDAEHLSRCLSTLRDDGVDALTEVIVVDNASTDGTAEVLEGFEESLPLLVLSLEVDTSFSAGNNLGLARASGEYVVFLNPDTLPTARVLSVCMAVLEEGNEVGLVGPSLVHPGGVDQDNGWQLPHPLTLAREHLRVIPRVVPPSGSQCTEVGWLMGCFLLGRADALRDIGGFDENFWFHGTDLELCARVRATGRSILRVDDVVLVHVGHQRWDRGRRRASQAALVQFTRREHGSLAAYGVASLARLAEAFRS